MNYLKKCKLSMTLLLRTPRIWEIKFKIWILGSLTFPLNFTFVSFRVRELFSFVELLSYCVCVSNFGLHIFYSANMYFKNNHETNGINVIFTYSRSPWLNGLIFWPQLYFISNTRYNIHHFINRNIQSSFLCFTIPHIHIKNRQSTIMKYTNHNQLQEWIWNSSMEWLNVLTESIDFESCLLGIVHHKYKKVTTCLPLPVAIKFFG